MLMNSRASAISVTVFSIVLIGGVIGFAVWKAQAPATPKTSVQPASADGSGSSSLNVVSSSATPLGNLPGENNSNQQNNSSSNNAGGTTSNSSKKTTVDPSSFKEYEKYKTEKNALFGDVSVGNGAVIGKGSRIAVNYRGWLTDGTKFDENIDPSKPLIFTVGEGKVIAGFEQGVTGMKVGGERLLIIPPSAGYGALPQGPIPGNSVLVFDVTILEASESTGL